MSPTLVEDRVMTEKMFRSGSKDKITVDVVDKKAAEHLEWAVKQHALFRKRGVRLLRSVQADKDLLALWKAGREGLSTILLVQILRELKKLNEPRVP
jgi:hypothetical protein